MYLVPEQFKPKINNWLCGSIIRSSHGWVYVIGRYQEAKRAVASVVTEAKTWVWKEFFRTLNGLKEVLVNRQTTHKGKAGFGSGSVQQRRRTAIPSGDIGVWCKQWWKQTFGEILSPYQNAQQTGPVVPIFKKREWRVCSNYQGIILFSLPWKRKRRLQLVLTFI